MTWSERSDGSEPQGTRTPMIWRQILLEPPDPGWVADFFEQQAAGG
jgi:hypothetical protein